MTATNRSISDSQGACKWCQRVEAPAHLANYSRCAAVWTATSRAALEPARVVVTASITALAAVTPAGWGGAGGENACSIRARRILMESR